MIPCRQYPRMRYTVIRKRRCSLIDNALALSCSSIIKSSKKYFKIKYESYDMERISHSPRHEEDTMRDVCFLTRLKNLRRVHDELFKR